MTLSSTPKVTIVGIGDDGVDGLTEASRRLIAGADRLIGSQATLDRVPASDAERIAVGGNPGDVVRLIDSDPSRRTVILATGDPLFYGVARYLCDRLGKDRFEVVPHVSSMQMAFARIKESWEDALLTSVADRPVERILDGVRVADKVGLFTSESCAPADVARALLDAGIDYFTAYVCENLGSPDERVTRAELAELVDQSFASLNVMVLVRRANVPDRVRSDRVPQLFGNPDDAFLQSRPKHGLLTPSEIRAMALAQMALRPDSIVWDIGAGSGSVAIEAAQIASAGHVYAMERDLDDHALILENATAFGTTNMTAVLGSAPQAWADLPDPDAIFVGGSGREVCGLVQSAYERLRPGGRMVASVGSIENIADVHRALHRRTDDVSVWMVNVARGKYQLERVRFEALNPSFLVSAGKPKA